MNKKLGRIEVGETIRGPVYIDASKITIPNPGMKDVEGSSSSLTRAAADNWYEVAVAEEVFWDGRNDHVAGEKFVYQLSGGALKLSGIIREQVGQTDDGRILYFPGPFSEWKCVSSEGSYIGVYELLKHILCFTSSGHGKPFIFLNDPKIGIISLGEYCLTVKFPDGREEIGRFYVDGNQITRMTEKKQNFTYNSEGQSLEMLGTIYESTRTASDGRKFCNPCGIANWQLSVGRPEEENQKAQASQEYISQLTSQKNRTELTMSMFQEMLYFEFESGKFVSIGVDGVELLEIKDEHTAHVKFHQALGNIKEGEVRMGPIYLEASKVNIHSSDEPEGKPELDLAELFEKLTNATGGAHCVPVPSRRSSPEELAELSKQMADTLEKKSMAEDTKPASAQKTEDLGQQPLSSEALSTEVTTSAPVPPRTAVLGLAGQLPKEVDLGTNKPGTSSGPGMF